MNLMDALANMEADAMQEKLQKVVAAAYGDDRVQICHIVATRFLAAAMANNATPTMAAFTEFVERADADDRAALMEMVKTPAVIVAGKIDVAGDFSM